MTSEANNKKISNKLIIILLAAAVAVGGFLVYYNFSSIKQLGFGTKNNFKFQKTNPEFAQYISAFTTGYISSGSTIKIKFTSQIIENVTLNTPVEEELFSFDNDIEGEAYWIDTQTLEFRPKERLKAGEAYSGTFYLHKLLEVKDELKKFEFQFKVVTQSMKVEFNDLKSTAADDFAYYQASGIVYTADFVAVDKIEQVIKPVYEGKTLPIHWTHDAKNTTHRFAIDSMARGMLLNTKLIYQWDAASIGLADKGEKEFTVPAKGTFTLLNVQVVTFPEQYVQVALSNPLNTNQSLEGLVKLGDFKDLKLIVDHNHIKIYPNEIKSGSYKLKISNAIEDAQATDLDKNYEQDIVFEEIKPSVNFVGKGVILPSSNGLSIPFEAVNLKAIDVSIVKIFENNILQHLQSNDLDGGEEMARVGKKIIEKTINLGITNPADFKYRKKFSLDLSSLIKAEPGAIYRITLGFKKAYSTFSCGGVANTDNMELEDLKETIFTNEPYSYYNEYDYEDGEEYDWSQRENPCNGAFYSSYSNSVSRNILASDIGLTLKQSNDGSLFVAATNLVTAQPMAGIDIELYDYQKQLIQTTKTNGDGMLFLMPNEKPYFIIAKKDLQKAYLKLDDGASLSLTMFDTKGETIQKGVKGFIYGERGVWRPGDTLFLSFVLEDKMDVIPENHPVMMELHNPQGLIYKKILKSKGLNGFYTFPMATDLNAPTGNWLAVCKVGAIEFSKNIRIETVMPNRLKLNVKIGDNKIINANDAEKYTLHTNWLTGANAPNMAATVAVSLTAVKTEFPKYEAYQFDDLTQKYNSENITLFDGKTNGNGDVTFPLEIETKENVSGMLKANFNTRVYEAGGAFSVDRLSVTYSPYEKYVGLLLPEVQKNSEILLTGRNQEIKIATVNHKGEPVSCSRLKVQVYKLNWRWWWDQYEDELANYASSDYHKPVLVQDVSSSGGKASFNLNIADEDWGRYLIRVSDLDGGHSSAITTYFDNANWMDRGGADNKIVATLLQFSTEKESYKSGEEAVVNIPSPKGGRALITIETGSKILEAHWLETEKGNTKFRFKVTPQMAPNIYIHVSLIQPHAQTANDLPMRLYGVVPLQIDDPETHLRPLLSMPNVLAPETNTSITVSEENGKDMSYTLAIVDEGLLDLTRFATPDPWANFYAREGLGVKTWDVYDQVIGAYGGELERILSIGGDGNEINKDAAKTNRFKPMVKFMGPFYLKKGEKTTHTFKMPMYIGSVRTMVIAGYQGAYGFAEKSTPVKSPIMLLGTLPRVLSVNEEVKLPVSVFGGDANLDNVTVSVESNTLVQLVGASSQVVNIKKDEEKLLTFDLKVKSQTGVAKVTIKAVSGAKKTYYTIELDVRNPNPYRTDIKEFFLDAGKTLNHNYAGIGVAGTNSGVVELSTIPPINLESRLNYLITYPHGCIEQTVSAAFAQLHLEEVTAISASKKGEIETNVKAAIGLLQKFQMNDGAFSYWPGENRASDWGSLYAGHFLFSAEKKGYTIPAAMKQNWIKYQTNTANNWEYGGVSYYNDDFIQSYRLYVLALSGKASLSAMNRLREQSNINLQAKWRLAAAYALTNNLDIAEKIINKITTEVKDYRIDYYTFGSTTRDEAMILETLCLLNKKTQAFAILKRVAAQLSGKGYLSTQSTAYGLVSVAHFIKKYGDASAMQAEVAINNVKTPLKGNSPISILAIPFAKNNSGTVNITNNGKGILYVRLINRGKPAVGVEKEEQENIVSQVVYKSDKNEVLDVSKLKQGTNFIMEVTIKNTGTLGDVENLALLNYIPSGWEIHNARMDGNEAALQSAVYDYQDIRDDKIMTYFNLKANQSKTFKFGLNASYCGTFYLPGINAEAMYDNSVFSRKKGMWIKVVK